MALSPGRPGARLSVGSCRSRQCLPGAGATRPVFPATALGRQLEGGAAAGVAPPGDMPVSRAWLSRRYPRAHGETRFRRRHSIDVNAATLG
jgi:hypothetical protein